jgi:hypothetical protein
MISSNYSPQSNRELLDPGKLLTAPLPATHASMAPPTTEYSYGSSYRFADLNASDLDEFEQRKLAAWLAVRFEMNSGALSRKLGRPSSTVHGWVKQFERLPFEFREAVIHELDERFLR